MNQQLKFISHLSVGVALLLSLNGCGVSHPNSTVSPEGVTINQPSNSFASSTVCAKNKFLQKYQCSFTRIEQAARIGDPDAQYALGYLYYYGIGTTQDKTTGLVWIKKAAAQGQPLAQNALKALAAKQTSQSLHNTSTTESTSHFNPTLAKQTNVPENGEQQPPPQPLTNILPNYGQQRVNTTATTPQ